MRFSVVQEDGAAYVAGLRRTVDALLVDAFDRNGISASLASLEFYENARRCLSPIGVFVMNLAGEEAAYVPHLEWIRAAFGKAVITAPVEGGINHVVFAAKDKYFEPQWRWLVCQAKRLEERFGLEFSAYVQQFRRCYSFDSATHMEAEN
jgi:spermidine synthase